MADAPRMTLNDGNIIPRLGFGSWQVDDTAAPQIVGEAIRIGYRLIDSAQGYENETGVGQAVRESDVPREDLFVTTKLRNRNQGFDSTLNSFDDSMRKLGLETLDLFLIHWPMPERDTYTQSWKAMVRLQQEGRVRSIGVSNFLAGHLDRIIGETGVTPVLNQIELHPGYQQRDMRAYHAAHGIATQSWSPLGRGGFLEHPVITDIAGRHGRSPAQVILRWHLDQGLIAIPKSANPGRMAENFDVFGFELDAADITAIGQLDDPNGKRGGRPESVNTLS